MFHPTYSWLLLGLIPPSASEVHRWFIADNPVAQARSESWDYLGAYHSRHPHYIYRQRGDAAAGPSLRGVEQVIVQSKADDTAYIWVEASPVAPGLEREEPHFLESLVALVDSPLRVHNRPDGQTPMGNSRPSIDLIWSSNDAAVLSIPKPILPRLDMYLPRFFEPVLIPLEPLPLPLENKEDPRIKEILDNLRFDADVASILSGLSLAQMVDDIRWLTGEASDIISRHSFSDGSRVAANWLKKQFESTGAVCELLTFLEGFAPNVRCLYESEKNNSTTVILGAHYDSRGSFGSTRAPGGDDDGSGTTELLAIAKAIERKSVKFSVNVELVAFAGEEQGLLGSRAYATELRNNSADILLMIQSDMLAYHSSDEPMQLGLPDIIGSPLAAQIVSNISAIYVPELKVGYSPVCCSDHQSFYQNGFTTTQMFERAGPIIDPRYHHSLDVSERVNYDFNQLHAIAKVTFATLLHTAGYYREIIETD